MEHLEDIISKNKIVIFSSSSCHDVKQVTELFNSMKLHYKEVQLDKIGEHGIELRQELIEKTGQKSLPNTFVKGWHVGTSRYTSHCAKNGTIQKMLDDKYEGFDYDLMVIGEGPGASMAATESARLGVKVAICNYLIPSVQNGRSGVMQRCLYLNCDPNRQIQRAGIIGTHITDSSQFGWEIHENVSFSWDNLISSMQNHGKDNSSKCVKSASDLLIMGFNAMPSFESNNVVKLTDKDGKVMTVKARTFIIATSTYAKHFDIPGSSCVLTPEDIFCLSYHPGKVIMIGCSEAGLCCAGNLVTSNISVTLLLEKPNMEDYDQQMVGKLIEDISNLGGRVYKDVTVQKIEVISDGKPGEYIVTIRMDSGETIKEKVNTMVFANGRLPDIQQLGLESIGIEYNKDTGQIITDEQNRTNVGNIFALGSVSKGKHRNMSAARAAMLLVHRLYGTQDDDLKIIAVPSLISSSIDYGFVGLSEEEAMETYGSGNIEVYHSEFKPLEYRFSSRYQKCYVKLVCVKSENELVVGLHATGPYAGDVIQGFSLGMKLGAKRSDFQQVIGIHPTTAEEFTGKLTVTKSSGEQVEQTEC